MVVLVLVVVCCVQQMNALVIPCSEHSVWVVYRRFKYRYWDVQNISVICRHLLVLLQRIYYTFNNSLKAPTVLLSPHIPN